VESRGKNMKAEWGLLGKRKRMRSMGREIREGNGLWI
jgi:hypothetical protein